MIVFSSQTDRNGKPSGHTYMASAFEIPLHQACRILGIDPGKPVHPDGLPVYLVPMPIDEARKACRGQVVPASGHGKEYRATTRLGTAAVHIKRLICDARAMAGGYGPDVWNAGKLVSMLHDARHPQNMGCEHLSISMVKDAQVAALDGVAGWNPCAHSVYVRAIHNYGNDGERTGRAVVYRIPRALMVQDPAESPDGDWNAICLDCLMEGVAKDGTPDMIRDYVPIWIGAYRQAASLHAAGRACDLASPPAEKDTGAK